MRVRVTVTIDGVDEVIARLNEIGTQAQANLQTITAQLASDTEAAWKQATPVRSGKLRGEEYTAAEGLSFTLNSPTYYYKFLDRGHRTPAGWHTKRGWRPAKRRSYVEGRHMTDKAVEFVKENIEERLSHFLDGA